MIYFVDKNSFKIKLLFQHVCFCFRTLLELGASPNYKDSKGLTPLYMCVMHASDVVLGEMLLHDHAIVGAQDLQGWQEVHQVCTIE